MPSSFRTAEEVLFYFACKKHGNFFGVSDLFGLLDQVVKLSFPLPRQDARFKDLVVSLVHKLEDENVHVLAPGAALLLKISSDSSLAPKLLPACLAYKTLFDSHKLDLSPADFVSTVGFLAKHKSIDFSDMSILRLSLDHASALRPQTMAVLLEWLPLFKNKELISEIISKVCLNIRSSDFLTAYSAADLTVGLWKFFPHMRTSVARAALYDLARVWTPKFQSFTLNRKIQLLVALSELHVSLPEIDGFVRGVLRDVAATRSEISSPNRLVDIVYVSAMHNVQSEAAVEEIVNRVRLEKSVFALSAENRVNLLWSLHVLNKDSHPLAHLLIDHFNEISASSVPFSLRSASASAKKLHDVAVSRSLRVYQNSASFARPLIDALATAESTYFDRCIATTTFYREARHLLTEMLALEEHRQISDHGILAPLLDERSRLVIEFDTGRDSYNFRLRKRIWTSLNLRVLVLSERMWRTVRRSKTERKFLRESLDRLLN